MSCATREIGLTRGFFATVSEVDYEHLSRYKWHAVTINKKTYARRSFALEGKIRGVYMHRQIMSDSLAGNLVVDHINGNGLDNTRENLRAVTPAQNASNNLAFTSALKMRGVYKQANGFTARVRHAGVIHYLGFYKTANEAAFMVNQKLDELRQGFGARNLIDYDALLVEMKSRRDEIDAAIKLIQETKQGDASWG